MSFNKRHAKTPGFTHLQTTFSALQRDGDTSLAWKIHYTLISSYRCWP
jgi:hypothetical protein